MSAGSVPGAAWRARIRTRRGRRTWSARPTGSSADGRRGAGAAVARPAGVRTPGFRSVAATFVTLGLTYGVWYAYSVFLVALLRDFGWSRTVVAGAFSTFTFVHGCAGVVLGPLADRWGPRRIMLAGGVLLAVALPLDSLVRAPWQLYVAYGILTGTGVAAAGWVPAVVLVQRWFPSRLGFALGATSAGIGVGIALVVPSVQVVIDAWGWRWAFRALAAAMLVWVIPATLLLVRDPAPAPMHAAGAPRLSPADAGITLADALRRRSFWLLGLAQILANTASQMLMVHQAVYLVDHGIPALLAATVVSVVGATSIAGKVGGGWLSDRFGREHAYSAGMACILISICVLGLIALAPSTGLTYVYAVFIGLGYASTAPLMPAVISDLFRGRHFGAIFGTLHLANALGGSLGPWLGGLVFDATGSYRGAFGTGAAGVVLSAALLWIVGPRRARAARREGTILP